jgi:hypothetical protein
MNLKASQQDNQIGLVVLLNYLINPKADHQDNRID